MQIYNDKIVVLILRHVYEISKALIKHETGLFSIEYALLVQGFKTIDRKQFFYLNVVNCQNPDATLFHCIQDCI
jgi:hypothetical protein